MGRGAPYCLLDVQGLHRNFDEARFCRLNVEDENMNALGGVWASVICLCLMPCLDSLKITDFDAKPIALKQ